MAVVLLLFGGFFLLFFLLIAVVLDVNCLWLVSLKVVVLAHDIV